MNQWFMDHIWLTYAIIYVLVAYVYYNVFRTGKLALWKNIIVYLLLALGNFILLYFQLLGLPIIPCLLVAIALMFIVRIRAFVESRSKRKAANRSGQADKTLHE